MNEAKPRSIQKSLTIVTTVLAIILAHIKHFEVQGTASNLKRNSLIYTQPLLLDLSYDCLLTACGADRDYYRHM